jgi:hypothetical protein
MCIVFAQGTLVAARSRYEMKADLGARTSIYGSSSADADPGQRLQPDRRGKVAQVDWLRGAINRIVGQQRPRVPGWGFLEPHQVVGEYNAEKGYLLLVFDHRGQPHTRRFSADEIRQLELDRDQAAREFRNLIESFCSNA